MRAFQFGQTCGAAALVLCVSSVVSAGCDSDSPTRFTEIPLTGIAQVSGAKFLNDAGEVAGTMPGGVVYVWQGGEVVTHVFEGMVVTANGLNELGVVTGIVRAPASNETVAYVWDSRAGGVTFIDPTGGIVPSGINIAGDLCGIDGAELNGVVYDGESGLAETITFDAPSTMAVGTNGALAISDAGIVVGSEVVFDDLAQLFIETPYVWTETGGITALPVLEALVGGRATAVNGSGEIAGWVGDLFDGPQPCVWRDGGETLEFLGTPFGYFTATTIAMNDHEQYVMLAPNDLFGFNRAFVRENGAYVSLTQPSMCERGLYAWRPLDINNNGEILVQLGTFNGPVIEDVVILRPIASCAGDCFTTGGVDFADLISILFVLGEEHADERCDADGDGVVAFNDLVAALFAYGGCGEG